jgi:cyclopropane-fatty-acyl-phospholipid synthase
MSLKSAATRAFESVALPDSLTSAAIDFLVGQQSRSLRRAGPVPAAAFLAQMANRPIAEQPEAANAQHYEIPAEFFGLILGPRRKYSCCLYRTPADTLAEAEEHALAETALHAGLADGQDILELGCGWGSLSLWMAERFPAARITAVSNSAGQRTYIEAERDRRGLGNLRVVTADMNAFMPDGRFDRIVSVEMFEHMSNWRLLLERMRGALRPDGRLFLHVFSHRTAPYRFDHANQDDWIAQHFFTGGIMPSHGLIRHFDDVFQVEDEWVWSGAHYRRTALDWLANYDRNAVPIETILRQVYGPDWTLWRRRWRLFFLATAGLFGARDGAEWAVSHYRLTPVG